MPETWKSPAARPLTGSLKLTPYEIVEAFVGVAVVGAKLETVGGVLSTTPQPGIRNEAIRVCQGRSPVVATYSLVYQKVQPSTGSTASIE